MPQQPKRRRKQNLSYLMYIAFSLMTILPALIFTFITVYYVLPRVDENTYLRIGLFIGIGLAVAFAGFFLVMKIVRSILKTLQDVRKIADGDVSLRVRTEGQAEEINELAKSFNKITTQLEQNIHELRRSKEQIQKILQDVTTSIITSQSVDTILDVVLKTTVEAMRAQRGVLWIYDKEEDVLKVKNAVNFEDNGQSIYTTTVKIGEGIIGWVAKNGKSVLIPKMEQMSKFANLLHIEEKSSSILCSPLLLAGETRGVITILNRIGKDLFNEDDMLILNNLATQLAVALDNATLRENVDQAYFQTIAALALAVESKDKYTRGHSQRVSELAVLLGTKINLEEEHVNHVKDAAILHDIGKIGIVDELLNKEHLTDEEYETIKQHPIIGENIVKPVVTLAPLCPILRHHHERVDGKGFPDGIRGDEISIGAKILAIADAFDAMVTNRPYRHALPFRKAISELTREAGTQFDEQLVGHFLEVLTGQKEKISALYKNISDVTMNNVESGRQQPVME